MVTKLDSVEQASLESFPASDPPAFGSAHAAPSGSTINPELERTSATSGPELRALKRMIMGVMALGAVLTFIGVMRRRRSR